MPVSPQSMPGWQEITWIARPSYSGLRSVRYSTPSQQRTLEVPKYYISITIVPSDTGKHHSYVAMYYYECEARVIMLQLGNIRVMFPCYHLRNYGFYHTNLVANQMCSAKPVSKALEETSLLRSIRTAVRAMEDV